MLISEVVSYPTFPNCFFLSIVNCSEISISDIIRVFQNSPWNCLFHLIGNLCNALVSIGVRLWGRRFPIAQRGQQRLELFQQPLTLLEIRAEFIGRIESGEHSPLAHGVPFRSEWANMHVQMAGTHRLRVKLLRRRS